MDWNEDIIAQLRALWAEGHSTAEIGRRMGISKNAVVGKAHRLTLPPRPSPIRREEGERRPAAPRRVTGPTLPPLPETAPPPAAPPPAAAAPQPAAAGAPRPASAAAAERLPEPSPAPDRAPRPPPVLRPVTPPPQRRVSACCWPIGEPGTAEFRFCDADAVQGRPYCVEHVQVAYVRVRERREDAA